MDETSRDKSRETDRSGVLVVGHFLLKIVIFDMNKSLKSEQTEKMHEKSSVTKIKTEMIDIKDTRT